MDEFLNKLKQGVFKVKDEAEKITKDAVDKTKKTIDRTKYSYSISGIESRINGILQELGKKIYDEYENGTEFDGDIAEKCEQIDEMKKEIEEIKLKIAETKNGTVCPECGCIVDEKSAFCNNCGSKIE